MANRAISTGPAATVAAAAGYWTAADVDVAALTELVEQVTPEGEYPSAEAIVDEVIVYDMNSLTDRVDSPVRRRELMAEIGRALGDGPGIVVFRNAVDGEVLDRATAAFAAMIQAERETGGGAGDHFAEAGANDRVWNALEKLAVGWPAVFVDYYASPAIALASEAWLGPGYQMTSQINVVNPGGAAQSPHRDYHLGFMTNEQAERFPVRAHLVSPQLTLQGAVAHVDMAIESGPTKLLPHSHKYPLGYLAWRDPRVIELFEARYRQYPLAGGDAVFFSPALFHAAGSNRTAEVRRMGNLLQISSPFGRAMESMDRTAMVSAIYPELLARRAGGWPAGAIGNAIAAAAEGYAFPTNLDRDPPIGGLAPPSQADLVHQALAENWSPAKLDQALADHHLKRQTY